MGGSILLPNAASPAHGIVRIHGAWTDIRIPKIAAQLNADDPDLLLVARTFKDDFVESYDLYWRGQFHASWSPREVDRILHDVAVMRAGAEGRVESVTQRIERNNAAKEKAAWSVWRENYHQALERFADEAAKEQEGRAFFGQMGRKKDG